MAIASAWYSVDTDARCAPGRGLEAFGAGYSGPSTLVGPAHTRPGARGTVRSAAAPAKVALMLRVTGPRSLDVRPSLSRAAPPTDVPGPVHHPRADRSRRRPRSSAAVRRAGSRAPQAACWRHAP